MVAKKKKKKRDEGDNGATWRSDLWRLQSIKCSCTRLPPNPCVKGMGSAPAQSWLFCTEKKRLGGGMEGDFSPLHSTHAHYGQRGCRLTCAGCQTHCQTLVISLKSDCLHKCFPPIFYSVVVFFLVAGWQRLPCHVIVLSPCPPALAMTMWFLGRTPTVPGMRCRRWPTTPQHLTL